jgi:tungstate transport system ATP-binding protein
MTNIIEIVNIIKRYGSKEVLHVDNLAIRKGLVTALIGPSGAGKSTLLRILNLLESPTGGDVLYDGRKAPAGETEKLALRRKMTMVFQKPALLDMSVYDNISFGLRARGISHKEIEWRVHAELETIGMAPHSRQNAKTLSGGEAQRVAFARAVVLRPKILFLDEPTANLDPVNVELLESMILRLNREEGTTVLVVTHNLFQAQRLAHDTAFLYQGQLIESGPTARVFHEPCREETRAFVEGKMIY